MRNGSQVAAFERAFAGYVGAEYAVALCNGTATLHTALVALGVGRGDAVSVPPLTMSATTIAVLHAEADPVFVDVDPRTWLAQPSGGVEITVSLYGLCPPAYWSVQIDDAAQTLRPHSGCAFTSYSFQASKILPLGEGGMLVTNDPALATEAREFSSLGYRMRADQPRIDPAVLKSPTYERHHRLGWNYRMSDLVAAVGLDRLASADRLKQDRREAAARYADAVAGCDWLTPQYVPPGWEHDFWCYAVAVDTPDRWATFVDAVVRHGGERPYAAWRLTYREPAFHDPTLEGTCPVAESLQPRLVQFQTNDIVRAETNARAVRRAIEELT
jgi:perosamine synthetase